MLGGRRKSIVAPSRSPYALAMGERATARGLLGLSLSIVVASASACSSGDGPAPAPEPPSALEIETGIPWNVVTDPRFGTLAFAEPRQAGPLVLSDGRGPTEAALVFLESHGAAFTDTSFVAVFVPEAGGASAVLA